MQHLKDPMSILCLEKKDLDVYLKCLEGDLNSKRKSFRKMSDLMNEKVEPREDPKKTSIENPVVEPAEKVECELNSEHNREFRMTVLHSNFGKELAKLIEAENGVSRMGRIDLVETSETVQISQFLLGRIRFFFKLMKLVAFQIIILVSLLGFIYGFVLYCGKMNTFEEPLEEYFLQTFEKSLKGHRFANGSKLYSSIKIEKIDLNCSLLNQNLR